MLLNTRELVTYSATAKIELAGSVQDLLIEDDTWSVRYIVVDTEGFLTDNNVVLSSRLIEHVDPLKQRMAFALDEGELTESVPASQVPPVSAHHNDPNIFRGVPHDPHLRSAIKIGEYAVYASDGELGRAQGLVVETSTWIVRYLVVDTVEFLSSKQVLLAPSAIRKINWETRTIETDLTVATIDACPEYDLESEITRQYEAFLHSYYGWRPYWELHPNNRGTRE